MTISILMFCPQFRPLIGGAERQAEKLARALVAKGIRVKILTPRYSPETPLQEVEGGLKIIRFPLYDLCRQIPWMRGLGLLNLLTLRWQVMRAVALHIDKTDILHAHIASPITAFAMHAANSFGVPVICKVASASDVNDFSQTAIIGPGGKLICSSMIRRMSRWIAITKPVAEILKQWRVPEKLIVSIPNGVELPKGQQCCTTYPATKFLYLGRLSAKINRDVYTLIRAFDLLANCMPDIELAIIGDGDQYQETATLIKKCRHRDRIQLPGLQEPDPWLQWADCFVLPSRREGLSNALLEAMSYGLPCIANDIPPNREVLKDGEAGILVPVKDVDKLLLAMKSVAEDANLGSFYSHAAVQRVLNTYSIESVASQYIELYKELIDLNTNRYTHSI